MVVVAYYEYVLCALLLYRLMQKASANPSINGTVVEIWAPRTVALLTTIVSVWLTLVMG
jgi:hypothetical protein